MGRGRGKGKGGQEGDRGRESTREGGTHANPLRHHPPSRHPSITLVLSTEAPSPVTRSVVTLPQGHYGLLTHSLTHPHPHRHLHSPLGPPTHLRTARHKLPVLQEKHPHQGATAPSSLSYRPRLLRPSCPQLIKLTSHRRPYCQTASSVR